MLNDFQNPTWVYSTMQMGSVLPDVVIKAKKGENLKHSDFNICVFTSR